MAEATMHPRSTRRGMERARWQAGTTPGQLRLLSLVIAGVAITLTVVGVAALVVADVSAIGIQQRTVPAIVGMQRIHAWLSDADRSAANAYLAGGSEVTLSQQQYEADVAAASSELQRASEHNPGGDDASRRLRSIAVQVDQYAALEQTASVDDRQNLPVGTVYLHAGSTMMHQPGTGILAQVDGLRDSYTAGLDQANQTLRVTVGLGALYVVVALVLLGVLFRTQRFLRVRFRRRRNTRLLAATLLVVIVAVASGLGAAEAAQSIKTSEDQSYARLGNLWTIRALVYDANGNESLSLIANGGGAAFDQAFQAETRKLVDRRLTIVDTLLAERGQVNFNGLLADELRSAGSPAEYGAAVAALEAYARFMDTDTVVRSSASAGNQKAATSLSLGTDVGQLGFAFDEVDWDLGVVINMLQDEFDQAMTAGERFLGATAGLEVLILAVVGLAFWGVQPRINEYTAGARRQRTGRAAGSSSRAAGDQRGAPAGRPSPVPGSRRGQGTPA